VSPKADAMCRARSGGGLQGNLPPRAREEQAVHLEIRYPDADGLNRCLSLVKWLLAIGRQLAAGATGAGVAAASPDFTTCNLTRNSVWPGRECAVMSPW